MTTTSTLERSETTASVDETPASREATRATTLAAPVVTPRPARMTGDRGEGVISAAIAVLIIAFLGVMMWAGFTRIWTDIEVRTTEQIANIGAEGGAEQ